MILLNPDLQFNLISTYSFAQSWPTILERAQAFAAGLLKKWGPLEQSNCYVQKQNDFSKVTYLKSTFYMLSGLNKQVLLMADEQCERKERKTHTYINT